MKKDSTINSSKNTKNYVVLNKHKPVRLSPHKTNETDVNNRLVMPEHPTIQRSYLNHPEKKKPFLMLQFLRLLRSNKLSYSTLYHKVCLKPPFASCNIEFRPFGECFIMSYKRRHCHSDPIIMSFTTHVISPSELIGKLIKFGLLHEKDADKIKYPVKYLFKD